MKIVRVSPASSAPELSQNEVALVRYFRGLTPASADTMLRFSKLQFDRNASMRKAPSLQLITGGAQ